MTPSVFEIIIPGLLQWRDERRAAGAVLLAMAGVFAGLFIWGPCLLSAPESSYELMVPWLATSPSQVMLVRSLGLSIFILTWGAGLLEAHLYQPPPYRAQEDDRAFWKSCLTQWLQGDLAGARDGLHKTSAPRHADPFWQLMRAQFEAESGYPEEARRALVRCARLDAPGWLAREREDLLLLLQEKAP